MAMRECPECGSSVKLENMKRHFANVHPGKDPSAAISEEEHREIRRASRTGRSATQTRRTALIALVVIVVIGAGYFSLPYIEGVFAPGSFNIVTYCGSEGSVEHYHALLLIYVGGVQQVIPADVGISSPVTNASYICASGGHAIHTHDGSGILHLELPVVPPNTPVLGDFFEIWGEPVGPFNVAGHAGTVTATMYNTDTGHTTDYSSNPFSIPLYPSPQGPTANPYPIPQNLIWNGANGNGESGGFFTGEIIWLNVTA